VPTVPSVEVSDIPLLFASALGISLVAIGDTISTSGGFAARAGYEVDGNQELAGIGSANLAAGLFSGFPVSTSGSRTAVSFQSGAKTQLTGLVAAGLVLLMLLFVPGLVQSMPQPVLAAVIIAASISLFDVAELRRLFRVRRTELALAVACALGVMLVGVLEGIVIAVVLSMIYIFKRAWAPYSTVLGRPADVPGYHDIRRYPDAKQVPGLLIVRWSAPLFFANANQFRDRIRELVKASTPAPRWVLVAAEPITDIDTTAGAMLVDLDLELNAAGIHLAFAELQSGVRDYIVRYGLLETIDRGHLYGSVTEAVEAYRREVGAP
jgi:MFS superfamily sulfate permease-like transporter